MQAALFNKKPTSGLDHEKKLVKAKNNVQKDFVKWVTLAPRLRLPRDNDRPVMPFLEISMHLTPLCPTLDTKRPLPPTTASGKSTSSSWCRRL